MFIGENTLHWCLVAIISRPMLLVWGITLLNSCFTYSMLLSLIMSSYEGTGQSSVFRTFRQHNLRSLIIAPNPIEIPLRNSSRVLPWGTSTKSKTKNWFSVVKMAQLKIHKSFKKHALVMSYNCMRSYGGVRFNPLKNTDLLTNREGSVI